MYLGMKQYMCKKHYQRLTIVICWHRLLYKTFHAVIHLKYTLLLLLNYY